MVKKVDATLSTDVALNTLSASRSLSDLKTAVKMVTASYKAQTAELKTTGEAQKAAETRYKGLTESIKANRKVVDALKDKQKDLDTSTKEGAVQFAKYQKQIDSTKTKISSLNSQQDKAKNTMEGYQSGTIKLQQSLKSTQRLTDSYVKRLEAEGKQLEATKAKQNGLKSSIESSNKIYKNQSAEVDRISLKLGKMNDVYKRQAETLKKLESAGKGQSDEADKLRSGQAGLSRAINKANDDLNTQKIRMNKTAESSAKFKSELKSVDRAEESIHPTGLKRVESVLDKVHNKTEKTSDVFGKFLGAHLVADGITNVLSTISNYFTDMVHEGSEYNNEQQKMQATWKTLTGSAKDGNAMVGVTNKLSVAMGQTVEVTDELNQQFYHVLDSQKPTEQLTKSVLTMGDAVGLSSENVKNLGLNFTHMMSSSKMQLGDFNHITDALPMYGEALLKYEQKVQKNSKLTMSELRKQMSAGKISAKDAQNVMNELGKKYEDASENLMKTIPGMTRVIKSRIPALLGDIEKPFTTAKNPILGAVSRWASDEKTDKEFTALGKSVTKGLNTIINAFSKASGVDVKNAPKMLDQMIQGLTKSITEFSEYIARHAKDIQNFFDIFSQVSASETKILFATLKALLPVLKTVGKFADKHPKLFGDMFAGMIIGNTAMKIFGGLLIPVGKGLKGLEAADKIGAKILELGKNGNKAAKLLSPLATVVTDMKGAFKGTGKGLLGKGIGKLTGKGATTTVEDTVKTAGKSGILKTGLKGLGTAAKAVGPLDLVASGIDLIGMNKKNRGTKIGQATGNLAGGVAGAAAGTAILPGIGTVIGGIAGSLGGEKLGGKLGKEIASGLGKYGPKIAKTASKMWKGITDTFTGNAKWEKSLGKSLGKVTSTIGKTVGGWGKSIAHAFKPVTDFFGKVWKVISKSVSKGMKTVGKVFGTLGNIIKAVLKPIGKILEYAILIPVGLLAEGVIVIWKKIKKPLAKVWKSITDVFTGNTKWEKSIGKIFGRVGKSISKSMKSMGKTVKRLWKGVTDVFTGNTKWEKSIGKTFSKVGKSISRVWKTIKASTKSAWKLIKKYTTGPIKAIWNFVDKYIIKNLVRGIKRSWSGLKTATKLAWGLIKRYLVNPIKDMWDVVNKYIIKNIVKGVKRAWSGLKSATKSAWNLVKKYVVNPIKDVWDKIKYYMDKIGDKMSSIMKSIKKVWSNSWDSISDKFTNIWKSIKKHASDGINGIIGVLNKGIKGINDVLHKFGAGKNTIGKIPKVHLATGTGVFSNQRKAITKPTMAVLNDGNDSPETGNREILMHANGESELVQGKNTLRFLEPGAEVFNATESKMMMGLPHFASGTGIFGAIKKTVSSAIKGATKFASNAFSGLKNMFGTASKIVSSPAKYVAGLLQKPKGDSSVTTAIANGAFSKIKDKATSWWGGLWSAASSLLNGGGDGSVLLSKLGAGWSKTSGFGNRGAVSGGYSSHDGNDFSGGSIVHAISDGVVTGAGGAPANWGGNNGIGEYVSTSGGGLNLIYQELNGKNTSGAHLYVHKGDSVKAGDRLAKLGPSGTHVHIGATKHKMFSIGGSSTAGWLDVTKLKGIAKSAKKSTKSQKQYEKQVGSNFFKFIKKLGSMFGDAFGSGDGNYNKSMILKAARAMHVNPSESFIKMLQATIQSESGGRNIMQQIHDVNSGGNEARGILQFTPGTFKTFAVKGHTNIMNPYDQLLAFFNNSDWKHSIGHTNIWGTNKIDWLHSGPIGHRRYANGGIVANEQLAHIAEGNKAEAIIPLDASKRSRGWELVGKVAATFADKDNAKLVNTKNDNGALESKLDTLISYMGALIKVVNDKPVIDQNGIYNAYQAVDKKKTTLQNMSQGKFGLN